MTSLSTNIKLLLTGADETTMTFQEWRTAMNGIGNNSNMELIDTAIGELTKACAKKADGFVFNPETGVLQLTCEGEALEGDSTSTTIDLSRFYTKAEVDTLLDEAQNIKDVQIAGTSILADGVAMCLLRQMTGLEW